MNNQVLRDDLQCAGLTEHPMIVKTIMTQKFVQEKFDLLMLQTLDMNPVSFRRNAALGALDMFSQKVHCDSNLVGKPSKVYDLLLLLRLSNGF